MANTYEDLKDAIESILGDTIEEEDFKTWVYGAEAFLASFVNIRFLTPLHTTDISPNTGYLSQGDAFISLPENASSRVVGMAIKSDEKTIPITLMPMTQYTLRTMIDLSSSLASNIGSIMGDKIHFNPAIPESGAYTALVVVVKNPSKFTDLTDNLQVNDELFELLKTYCIAQYRWQDEEFEEYKVLMNDFKSDVGAFR